MEEQLIAVSTAGKVFVHCLLFANPPLFVRNLGFQYVWVSRWSAYIMCTSTLVEVMPAIVSDDVCAVRRPNGRSAIQRRAAAANFAVAAAVAAEAADALPAGREYNGRTAPRATHSHRRYGSHTISKAGLDHVRSGRITKTVSGGSSGGGSSRGSARFSSLMDALGDMEAREGGFKAQQQPRPTTTIPVGEHDSARVSGIRQRPALFDGGNHGFANRWHEPIGPVSPKILTLSSNLFQLGQSTLAPEGWSAPSLCHTSFHAGSQPQFPLFKTRDCAG